MSAFLVLAVGAITACVGDPHGVTSPPAGFMVPIPSIPVDTTTPPPLPPPALARLEITGLPSSVLRVGDSVRLAVRAWDTAEQTMGVESARWRVKDTTIARIDSIGGTLRALHPGSTSVGVTLGDSIAWGDVSVAAAPTAPAPPTPTTPEPTTPPEPVTIPTAREVELQLVRQKPEAGEVLVSSGIPLPPGALKPGEERYVRVVVDGAEVAQYVRALHSRHPDGSLRAVLVQFRADLPPSKPVPAKLVIGSARTVADMAAPTEDRGLPAAAALPVAPVYLIDTDLVGKTVSSAEAAGLGGVYARFESDFKKFSEMHWKTEGSLLQANYYDRALVYYAAWVRSGEPTYWWRAAQLAVEYRQTYLVPNNYNSAAHMAQMEGLEKHYLLTGDEASRTAVVRAAAIQDASSVAYLKQSGEGRIAARIVHATLLAWRLSPPGEPKVTGLYFPVSDWATHLDKQLARLWQWQTDEGLWPANAVCGGQLNYMTGQLNDALIKVYEYYRKDPKILAAVKKGADYMWATQWLPGDKAFKYASVHCDKVGGAAPAPDLNNLIVTTYGWLYRQTGEAKYREQAEQVFEGAVLKAFLSGTKQFNQQYTAGFRHFGYR